MKALLRMIYADPLFESYAHRDSNAVASASTSLNSKIWGQFFFSHYRAEDMTIPEAEAGCFMYGSFILRQNFIE